jgi:hypothetical protein
MNNYYTIDPNQEFQTTAYSLWQPDSTTNQKILVNSGINSNWGYRQYMTKNANQIMKYNSMESINASGNNPYTIMNNDPVNKSPYLLTSFQNVNSSSPIVGFNNSDLKQDYVTNEQFKSRMIAPTIPTNF